MSLTVELITQLFPFSLDGPAAQTCLNEYHLFFLLAGAFMGYCYSLLYFIHNMNYLPFPIIQVNYHLSITLCQNLVELKLHWLHLINSRFDQQNLGLKT